MYWSITIAIGLFCFFNPPWGTQPWMKAGCMVLHYDIPMQKRGWASTRPRECGESSLSEGRLHQTSSQKTCSHHRGNLPGTHENWAMLGGMCFFKCCKQGTSALQKCHAENTHSHFPKWKQWKRRLDGKRSMNERNMGTWGGCRQSAKIGPHPSTECNIILLLDRQIRWSIARCSNPKLVIANYFVCLVSECWNGFENSLDTAVKGSKHLWIGVKFRVLIYYQQEIRKEKQLASSGKHVALWWLCRMAFLLDSISNTIVMTIS